MRFKRSSLIVWSSLCLSVCSIGCHADDNKGGPGKVIGANRSKGFATGRTRTMGISSGQFDKGRKDGLRDAKNSLFEENGGWMWLWMADQEYQLGYEQGWTEGRSEVKFKANQKGHSKTMQTNG